MSTQDATKEPEAVIEQLQQQGKEPTVALVKARMKTPVPMPGLITAIKSCFKYPLENGTSRSGHV